MREIARLQRPDAVIVRRAVHEARPSAATRSNARAPGVRVDVVAGDGRAHHAQALPAAYSARLRSSIRSSGFSRPTDKPDRALGDAGARRDPSADIRKCVVRRRMDDQRFRIADVGEMREDRQRLDELAALRARAAQVEAEHARRSRAAAVAARARDPDGSATPDSRSPRPADASARNATILRVFSTWRAIRSGSVSMPCRIWNAVNGAMHAPKSRMPSRRARSRKHRRRRFLGEDHVVEARDTARSASGTCRAPSAPSQSKPPESTSTPPITTPWPDRNFVAEWNTRSAPVLERAHRGTAS